MDYNKQLSALRRKLAGNQMSLLVGSGFSKNVSRKFLTWDELLFDLVVELHGDEIEADFAAHIRNTIKRNRLRHAAFVKQKAGLILGREGYLNVVSDYVARKGYGEAIATYIEERTPYIQRDGDDITLTTDGVSEKIPQQRLALHRAIVKLPWNNIYTTNYDELLDSCIQNTAVHELQHTISMINTEVGSLNERESELREKLAGLESQAPLKDNEPVPGSGPADLLSGDDPDQPKNPAQQRYDINYDLTNLRKQKEEKEQQVRNLELSIVNSYQVITFAAGLKLRRNKNIVKLHGSLRSAEQRAANHFEFDGDFKNQYIISAEDYDEYPQKHEAFTQLMRISLLQESFCLIGFSGVDPNFLAWIGWVRDILQKQALKNASSGDYKIYLVDVQNEADAQGRRLFFENHSVVRIPLRSKEVLDIIAPHLEPDINISETEAIRLFLNYLTADEELTPFVPVKDLSAEQDRKAAWRELRFMEPHKKIDLDAVTNTVERLDKLEGLVFLPDVNHAYSFNQHSLINAASTQLNFYAGAPADEEWICRLVWYAVKDYMVPISNAVEPEVVQTMLKFPSVSPATKKLVSRAESLNNPGLPVPGDPYEEILRLAYSMQFDTLRNKLEEWQPCGKDVLRKAGFVAIYDPAAAVNILQEEIDNSDSLNGEERLYAFELLSYFKMAGSWSRDKKLDKIIGHYEHSGFRKLADNFEYLQEQLAPKPEKILPYGKGRFSTGRSVQWITFTKPEMAAQYIMLLADSGVQMALDHVTYRSSENWYPVFKTGFELYPLPFLYYSLQYGGEDFLKRVGQDYAFSTKLAAQLPEITLNLFRCQREAPAYMRGPTYYLLSELLNAVDPDVWENDFMRSWQNAVREDAAFLDRNNAENPFFIAGIKCIKNPANMAMIISDCLDSIQKAKDMGIDYLYHLNFNQHFKLGSRKNGDWSSLESLIDKVITDLPGKVDRNLFALGNLYSLLTPGQLESIKAILHKEDFTLIKNVRIWHIILYFQHGDKITVKAIKQAIIRHPKLWFTGIDGRSIKGGVESIDLGRITKGPGNTKGLKWDAAELSFLYDKITRIVPIINSVEDMPDRFISFTDVLEDMVVFLLNHQSQLRTKPGYEEILQLARGLLNGERQFDSTVQGILSNDNSPVVLALYEINRQVRTQTLDHVAFTTLLGKVMLQHQPGLEATLDLLAAWLGMKKEEERLIQYVPYINNLLRRYLDETPVDTNIPFIQQRLVSIAFTLQRWKAADPVIDQWLEIAARSNFNNVKQLLLKKRAKAERKLR